uniref:Receptor like tyrosine kinase n=1 Tax=Hucho hucho TaxID=62062 RepID=A0A4W5L7B2_9TELE
MNQPQSNISAQGEVPRTASVFRVDLFCSGKVDGEAVLTVQLNLTIHSNNFTVLNFKRRKICYKRKTPLPSSQDGVSIPTTSTRVFYISVGVCCAVIFLVAIILAVMHLHSMKRVELDDSVSDSGSSQGLSQPSTQTTQYLRADTPNNATAVTSYPSLRIEKNDLRSVSLLEAKAKVKDIAISRLRVTLRDVLHEGTFGRIFHGVLLDEKDPAKEKYCFVKTVKDHASEVQVTMMLTESSPRSFGSFLPCDLTSNLVPVPQWAFGVTLWELMTLGQTPYVDIDPFEMAAYLKDGYRIAQPINCPDELFAVMACCWALDPEERPKFQQLVQCLTEFHAALGAYV